MARPPLTARYRDAPDGLPRGPAWMSQALCRHYDPDLWFPETRGRHATAQIKWAKQVCSCCPVIVECGDYASGLNAGALGVVGIWGGRVMGWRNKDIAND